MMEYMRAVNGLINAALAGTICIVVCSVGVGMDHLLARLFRR
jgi:hypothetical protein